MKKRMSLIIHGGCGTYEVDDQWEIEREKEKRKGLLKAIKTGWALLEENMSALDVVEQTVKILEDFPAFNAGIGSAINRDGNIEMDASIMDGKTLHCGAVAGVINFKNPVSIARAVMEKTEHVLLVGEGANIFAKLHKFKQLPKEAFYTEYQLHWYEEMKKEESKKKMKTSTVGAVAFDSFGNIAAATSTGGLTMKMPGRVGDSPLIGSGTYADNAVGGVSCTGYGEQMIQVVLAKTALDFMEHTKQPVMKAAQSAISYMGKRVNGKGGVIMLDKHGEIGFAVNEATMPRAYMSSNMSDCVIEI